MIVGSTKEDLAIEKRVSLTPETAKNIVSLGLKICIEKNYAAHLGIQDRQYAEVGVEIKNSSSEVLENCNLLIKVNCPTDKEISNLKEKTILIGMLDPTKNENRINEIIKKKNKYFKNFQISEKNLADIRRSKFDHVKILKKFDISNKIISLEMKDQKISNLKSQIKKFKAIVNNV